ncbi:hypothetical protein Rhow_000611 [Rhodococcus wratislaviensis]|uniref:Uncharacterized protein n=1 Tax=Rhodococcus wratislaviensis TaxID=44752 RepID=A0A402C2D9_RHOWR|nr:hypothetical protein Rhow_000611 [Rhodococcus wratislaviensis]
MQLAQRRQFPDGHRCRTGPQSVQQLDPPARGQHCVRPGASGTGSFSYRHTV